MNFSKIDKREIIHCFAILYINIQISNIKFSPILGKYARKTPNTDAFRAVHVYYSKYKT